MRKEQKPAIIRRVIDENFELIGDEKKDKLFEKLKRILIESNVSCSPIVFQNTIQKLLSSLKFPKEKVQETIYNQIMLSDDDTIIEVYFDKKENGVYIDEDKLSDIISSYFDFSRISMPAIKNSLRSYMKQAKISEDTLKSYLEKAFTMAENLCIEKSIMSLAIYRYPGLIQQSDWQYKYMMFAKITDRKREELILDRSAFVPSCQLLYSKIKMLEYVEEKENIEIPKSYGRLINLSNELFYNRYVDKKIPIAKDQMRYYCNFWNQDENILPEVLEDILSWEGNEKIKEKVYGTSMG